MIEIRIVAGQCSSAELAATSTYLANLAMLDQSATDAEKIRGQILRGLSNRPAVPAPTNDGAVVRISPEALAGQWADVESLSAEMGPPLVTSVAKKDIGRGDDADPIAAHTPDAAAKSASSGLEAVPGQKKSGTPQPGAFAPGNDPAKRTVGIGAPPHAATVAGSHPATDPIARIDPADLPDVGVDPAPPAPSAVAMPPIPTPPVADPDLAAFGKQPAAALPNVALSTAVAGPPSIAPAAPPVSSTPAPNDSIQSAPPVPAAVVPPAPPAGSVPVDKDGFPWDSRIHSGSRAVNADKTWRKMRGVDPALVVSVEAELRQVMGAVPTAGADPKWPFQPPGIATNSASASTTSTAPAAAPEATGGTDPADSFARLMETCFPYMESGKLNMKQINEICARLGVSTIQMMANRPDLIPQAIELINAAGGA